MVIIRLSDPLAEAFLSCSILFSSSYPPTNEQKEIAEQERRPSHPNANPRHFTERRLARRSGVKSAFDFARSEGENASV